MKQKFKVGEHESELDTLDEAETRKLVGEELDSRFAKLEIPEALDADKLKADILGEMEGKFTELFSANKTDEDALVKKLEKSLEGSLSKALKGIGGNGGEPKERKPGWLSKALFS